MHLSDKKTGIHSSSTYIEQRISGEKQYRINMAYFNTGRSETDEQLIDDNFFLPYRGKWDYSDAQNVQAVLNKIKEKGYDRNLINQLMVALTHCRRKPVLELSSRYDQTFEVSGNTLYFISSMSCVYITVLAASDFIYYKNGLN